MKKLQFILVILLSAIVVSSCSSTHKITVNGSPGTNIYKSESDNYVHLGTIENDGQVEIKLERELYYPYLLAQTPNSNKLVPFAMDYKNTSTTQTMGYTGLSLMSVGAIGMVIGVVADATVITAVSGGVCAVGYGLATPYVLTESCHDVRHSYKYLPATTNEDIVR